MIDIDIMINITITFEITYTIIIMYSGKHSIIVRFSINSYWNNELAMVHLV